MCFELTGNSLFLWVDRWIEWRRGTKSFNLYFFPPNLLTFILHKIPKILRKDKKKVKNSNYIFGTIQFFPSKKKCITIKFHHKKRFPPEEEGASPDGGGRTSHWNSPGQTAVPSCTSAPALLLLLLRDFSSFDIMLLHHKM